MKKAVILISVILIILTLCACDSEAVAAAKKAYAESNYEEVVAVLADEEITDASIAEMLFVSKANIAFSEGKYFEVVSLLQNTLNYSENELYNKSLNAAIKVALETYDVSLLVDVYELDTSIEEYVYQALTEACAAFEYDAFNFMERLIEKLPEGNLKESLSVYSEGSQKNKVKAFMRGDWKIVYDEESQDVAIVSVRVHEDDEKCVGFLTQVSKFMERYYYEVNDIYWKDFVFEKNFPIYVYNTVRYDTGAISGEVSTVELDMENAKMYIHVTGTVNPDRVYYKVA